MNTLKIIEKYYEKKSDLYKILLKHSISVTQRALTIADNHPELNIDKSFVGEAAMLHDIGIFLTYAPKSMCG